MARAVPHLDYVGELKSIRDNYVAATPRQCLSIIRQRLENHHFGANRLVTSVSAVEALARSLLMHARSTTRDELLVSYLQFKNRSPKSLVKEYLETRRVTDIPAFLDEDSWTLFGYAVDYRNMLAHECTILGWISSHRSLTRAMRFWKSWSMSIEYPRSAGRNRRVAFHRIGQIRKPYGASQRYRTPTILSRFRTPLAVRTIAGSVAYLATRIRP